MQKNSLFSYEPDSILRFVNTHTQVSTDIHTLTVSNFIYTLMLTLKRHFTQKVAYHHAHKEVLLKNIGDIIIDYQYNNNFSHMNFTDIYAKPHPIHIGMMCAQIGGKMHYRSQFGESPITLKHHTDDEHNVMIDFLIQVLSEPQDLQQWHHQPFDWITAWPQICEEWTPSFALGVCINYPTPLKEAGLCAHVKDVSYMEVPLL